MIQKDLGIAQALGLFELLSDFAERERDLLPQPLRFAAGYLGLRCRSHVCAPRERREVVRLWFRLSSALRSIQRAMKEREDDSMGFKQHRP